MALFVFCPQPQIVHIVPLGNRHNFATEQKERKSIQKPVCCRNGNNNYKLMMKKEIPFYKPNGKLCFFDKDELDQWLRRIRIAPQEEVDRQAIAYVTQKDLLK